MHNSESRLKRNYRSGFSICSRNLLYKAVTITLTERHDLQSTQSDACLIWLTISSIIYCGLEKFIDRFHYYERVCFSLIASDDATKRMSVRLNVKKTTHSTHQIKRTSSQSNQIMSWVIWLNCLTCLINLREGALRLVICFRLLSAYFQLQLVFPSSTSREAALSVISSLIRNLWRKNEVYPSVISECGIMVTSVRIIQSNFYCTSIKCGINILLRMDVWFNNHQQRSATHI